MDIRSMKDLAVDKRMVIRKLGETSSFAFESILIVEGFSADHNFIYGRIENGKTIGTLLPTEICGGGAVIIRASELNGFEVHISNRYKR